MYAWTPFENNEYNAKRKTITEEPGHVLQVNKMFLHALLCNMIFIANHVMQSKPMGMFK